MRALAESDAESRDALCARVAASANPQWAAATALECVAAAEDRLQKAVAERDRQGARMFAFFVNRVALDFENRAKFTEFRVLEIENRKLCGAVQEWTHAVGALQEAGREATARIAGDAAAATAVAERARRLVTLAKRPSQQAAVLASLRGDVVRILAPDAHGWAGAQSDRDLSTAALRLLSLAPDAVDVAQIVPCAQHRDPVVRRVAFSLLAAVGDAAAVDVLVGRVALEEGVPASEIATHLYALTQQTFGVNARAWAEWWETRRGGWTRDAARLDQAAKIEREPYSRYFGLDLRSARVLFVLDRSGSMSWPVAYRTGAGDARALRGLDKMTVATRELVTALQGLDERTSFNILAYGTNLESFQRRPVRATRENRERAAKWVVKLMPDGQTNLAGSLLAAMDHTRTTATVPDEAVADTIVVLSDGAPNCGPIAYESDVLAELRRLARDRVVTIHAVFLGVDGDEAFMRSLAEEHGGRFVHHRK